VLCAAIAGTTLSLSPPSFAEMRPHAEVGPRAGVSVNNDQWVMGGFARVGGLCPFVCLGDLGASLHALLGLGGNRATLRVGLRLDSLLWFDAAHKFALYPVAGASAYVLVPVGAFAEFCERTHLQGCGGTYWGAELGGGIRVWKVFVEGVVGTGQLPVVTATAGIALPVWETAP
jgi:hypothetical protein